MGQLVALGGQLLELVGVKLRRMLNKANILDFISQRREELPRDIATLDLKLMNDEQSVGEADKTFKNHVQKISENKN